MSRKFFQTPWPVFQTATLISYGPLNRSLIDFQAEAIASAEYEDSGKAAAYKDNEKIEIKELTPCNTSPKEVHELELTSPCGISFNSFSSEMRESRFLARRATAYPSLAKRRLGRVV
jgi:hypothetical protein